MFVSFYLLIIFTSFENFSNEENEGAAVSVNLQNPCTKQINIIINSSNSIESLQSKSKIKNKT